MGIRNAWYSLKVISADQFVTVPIMFLGSIMPRFLLIHLVQRLGLNTWGCHYEVVVVRQQIEYVVAREASRLAAERRGARICRQVELSRHAVHERQVRGVHPWRVTQLIMLLLVVTQVVPWLWLRLALSLVCFAVICGVLSSGWQWRSGGRDDR